MSDAAQFAQLYHCKGLLCPSTVYSGTSRSIRRFQAEHGKPDKLMFSFHGIPQPYADKGDPYPKRCKCTAAQVAHALGQEMMNGSSAFSRVLANKNGSSHIPMWY